MMREIHMSVRIVDRALYITRKEKKASYFKPMIRLWFKKDTQEHLSPFLILQRLFIIVHFQNRNCFLRFLQRIS